MIRLLRVQRDLKAPKNQRNNFGKYNYRSAEDIIEAVKPLLHAEGLLMLITDEITQTDDRIYVKAIVTIYDSETNKELARTSAFARETDKRAGMDASQITGSASSYARKYALNGMFAIDDTKDADTDEQHKQTKADVKIDRETIELWKNAVDGCGNESELTKLWKSMSPELQKELFNYVGTKGKELKQ